MSNDTPLKGLKVVELARVLAGPWIGQTLSDLGADVIKIEAPEGDDTRQWGPPFIERKLRDGKTETVSAYFHATNRGKKSVICDFSNSKDLKNLKALIADADVLIENFKVGGLKKFGLDYDSLSEINPRLIYTSITGFGQNGPRAKQPGYDFLIQGMCGIMDLTGDPKGEPQKVGVAWIDIFTGLYGVIGIQAALSERERSGCGQQIDLSLLDCGVGVLANQATNFLLGGESPKRLGNAHPNIVPYQVFPSCDGHLIVACGNDGQFISFCRVLGLDELIDNPDYSSNYANNSARVRNRKKLCTLLANATAKRTRSDLIDTLTDAGVPNGPINSVAEALNDPQIVARNMLIEPEGIAGLRTPIQFSRSEMAFDRAAPILGEGNWSFDAASSQLKDKS